GRRAFVGGGASQAHESGAVFEGDLERGSQAFCDLDGGAQGIVFDLADGDGGAGHTAGELCLGQVEGLAVLLDDTPKRYIAVHGCLRRTKYAVRKVGLPIFWCLKTG
ncbi:MAG: hypothetical protein MUO67_12255, partial [Anaerolineales bacterium]|nr:hypothetical protein [Anaerolineales bacterium]